MGPGNIFGANKMGQGLCLRPHMGSDNISDAEKQEQTGSNITTEIDNIRTISKNSSNHEKIKELLNGIPGVLND